MEEIEKVEIANIAAISYLGIKLDLDQLSQQIIQEATGFHYTYIPKDFPAARIKLPELKASVLIFSSGQLVFNGCKSKKDLNIVSGRTLEIISKYHKPIELPKKLTPDIKNVVCSANIGKEVGCGIVQKAYGPDSVEHSRFGGGSLVLRLEEGTIRSFPSGKLVGTGFSSIKTAKAVMKEVIKKIGGAAEKEKFDSERENICRLERFNPAAEIVYEACKKLRLTIRARLEAIKFLEDYCDELVDESLKAQPRSLAGGAIYIACMKTGERRTQPEVGETIGITSNTITRVYRLILRVNLKRSAEEFVNEIYKESSNIRSETMRVIEEYTQKVPNEWLFEVDPQALGTAAILHTDTFATLETTDMLEKGVSPDRIARAYRLLLEIINE